ncbi:protein late bloomer isoform X1 [Drosophila mauritiana]|uniref:Protein late bloomer isoform X1 n=2 Tax=Drosophila mauritiana TaxID=7226 RepID=A0A6P8JMC1_DROMA|nr:protein late bloomer isoform X1 [Drosophila mauritiana]
MVDNEETGVIQRLLSVGKLQIYKYIIYFVWVVNFIFTCADVYIYYFILKDHMGCWNCLFRSYMIIALTVNVLMVPLLIVGFIFIYSNLSGEIRIVIYATVLFLATWLQMMLTILFAQQYQIVGDVLRIWMNHKSLEFYERRCQCCGVLGPDDYKLSDLNIPKSCYKNGSEMEEDLYRSGCFTHSIKPSSPIIQVISFVIQYVLVICIKVFLIILLRSKTQRTSMWSERRAEMFGSVKN